MSDFKFSCPTCGQHIVCDTSNVGMSIACPSCHTTLTVPAPPAAPPPAIAPGLSIAASQARHTASEAQAHAAAPYHAPMRPPASQTQIGVQKTSGLAIASFICSLFFCAGCIPGIICGHLAQGKIKRDPSLKGSGFALAGLIISYLSVVVSLIMLALFIAGARKLATDPNFKRVLADAQQQQRDIAAGRKPSTKRTSSGPVTPDPLWTLNLTTAQFPDRPAAGKIGGQDFTVEGASVQGGIITLRQGKDFLPDTSMMIFTFAKPDESVAGKTYDISPANSDLTTAGPSPHIHISTRGNGMASSSSAYPTGYALKLELGAAAADGTIPGKIYACLPDDEKSYVAGNFEIKPLAPGATTPTPPKKLKKPKKTTN